MLPLEGVRVVEIAQNLAGPMVAEILAHMGADVIKIEPPEGDDARRCGPPFFKGTSPGYLAVNANKRWPELLAGRLVAARPEVRTPVVLNLSLAGNRLNHEGT